MDTWNNTPYDSFSRTLSDQFSGWGGGTYPGKASIGISGCCPGMAVTAASPSIGFTAGTPAITIQGV